ncbi:MAG: AAC(3) family N-acetyltransferase [Chloroflexi bacterium]|nr:AAC(3) family N-acetyltransferase [Chloroflexota bacterium]
MRDEPDAVDDSRPVVILDDIVDGLRALGLAGVETAVVHSSLSAFGWVAGGADTVVAAVRSVVPTVIAPAFTYVARLPSPPEPHIPFNAHTPSATWEEFHEAVRGTPVQRADSPINRSMGAIAAALAAEPDAIRSPAPICSFSGVGPRAPAILAHGTADHPLAVLETAAEQGAWILLLGVGHESNTTIHVAENFEHRGGFTSFARVADDPRGWTAVRNVGGSSSGFPAIEPHLRGIQRATRIGGARCLAMPAAEIIRVARELIRGDPTAMLASDKDTPGTTAFDALAKRQAYLRSLSST